MSVLIPGVMGEPDDFELRACFGDVAERTDTAMSSSYPILAIDDLFQAEFLGVYRNMPDGTQEWVADFTRGPRR